METNQAIQCVDQKTIVNWQTLYGTPRLGYCLSTKHENRADYALFEPIANDCPDNHEERWVRLEYLSIATDEDKIRWLIKTISCIARGDTAYRISNLETAVYRHLQDKCDKDSKKTLWRKIIGLLFGGNDD